MGTRDDCRCTTSSVSAEDTEVLKAGTLLEVRSRGGVASGESKDGRDADRCTLARRGGSLFESTSLTLLLTSLSLSVICASSSIFGGPEFDGLGPKVVPKVVLLSGSEADVRGRKLDGEH